jgi:hypothetical protein
MMSDADRLSNWVPFWHLPERDVFGQFPFNVLTERRRFRCDKYQRPPWSKQAKFQSPFS